MKKLVFALTFALSWAVAARAQESPEMKIFPKNQIIAPFKVEVTFAKTTHILFPAEVRYIDLGSHSIIAGKASGVENVVRVKAAVKGFEGETNFSVITADGSFYSFNTLYADEPAQLSIEMDDWLRAKPENGFSNNRTFVRLKEMSGEVPVVVDKIMRNIYRRNRGEVAHLESGNLGVQASVRSIHIHGNILYIHAQLRNPSDVGYDIDFVRFKIVDKKVARRTAIQETTLDPVRTHNDVRTIGGRSAQRHVYAFEKFTIPADKVLVMEIYERGGARHQSIAIESIDLLAAKRVNELKLK